MELKMSHPPSLISVDEVDDDDVVEGRGERWVTTWLLGVLFEEPVTDEK